MQDYAKRSQSGASLRHRLVPTLMITLLLMLILALLVLLFLQRDHEKSTQHPLELTRPASKLPANPVTEYDFYTELTDHSANRVLKSQTIPPSTADP